MIKLPTFVRSQKKQENSRKTSISASLTILKHLCKSQQAMGNSSRNGNTGPPYLSPEKPICNSRSNSTRYGTMDWFKIGKGVHQGYILSPCLFNLNAEYIMRNTGLDEAQAGIKIARKISITSDMQMTPPLWQKVKRN